MDITITLSERVIKAAEAMNMTPQDFVNMVLNAPNPQDSVRAVMFLRKQAAPESRAEGPES